MTEFYDVFITSIKYNYVLIDTNMYGIRVERKKSL